MTESRTLLSRRSIVRIGGLTAAGALAFPSAPISASDVAPIDRGSIANGGVRFLPIAARSEAGVEPDMPPRAPKDRIGFAIVALGRLSMEEILPAFAQTRMCKVTALVSGSPDKLKAVVAQYAIPPDSLYSYDDFDSIAQNENVQIIYIVLPNAMHKEFTLRAASARKHVLCEKPIATTIADAQVMVSACADAKVKLMIAYRCRYQRRRRVARCGHLLSECGARCSWRGANGSRGANLFNAE